ncbi:TPA: hypothetical protein ACGHHJ_004828, partial [Salmonella enterica subsp. enterica serovar Frintrop]
ERSPLITGQLHRITDRLVGKDSMFSLFYPVINIRYLPTEKHASVLAHKFDNAYRNAIIPHLTDVRGHC